MKSTALSQLARVIVIAAVASVAASGAPNIKQVHPPATAGGNPSVLIAVLADHYAAGQEQEFDYDVENFFTHGLLVDDYYKTKLGDLKIKTYFEATPAGQDSKYEFTIEPGAGNCAVGGGANTVNLIDQALGGDHPVHTVVLGNHPYNFGCTDGSWTYVAVDAVGTDVLPHEFGHILAELFDEWSVPENKTVNYPGVIPMDDTRNCWPTKPVATKSPHWKRSGKFPQAKEFPECDLFGQQVVHPFEFCRMGTRHEHHGQPKFCEVCASSMDDIFLYYRDWRAWMSAAQRDPEGLMSRHGSQDTSPQPRFRIMNASSVAREQDRTEPTRILRLTVKIDPESGSMTATGRTAATGTYVPSYRRLGQFAFEYVVDGKTVEFGVIPDHLFEARGYRGGAAHRDSRPQPAEVVIAIPNEDLTSIQAGTRELRLYRIPNGTPGRIITLETIATLRKSQKPLSSVSVK